MPKNIAKEQRKVKIIASSLVALFLISMLFILFLNARSSYASNSSDIAQTTNSDPYAQFCSSFYHVTSSTPSSGPLDKYNECLTLGPQFENYLHNHSFTLSSLPVNTTTITPTDTTTITPTDTTTLSPSDATTITPTDTTTLTPTDTTTLTPTDTTTPTGTAMSTPDVTGGIWPKTSLVELEVPADAGKTGNSIPAADATHVENDLTVYLLTAYTQMQASSTTQQQATYLNALENWINDPLLSLALVTYTSTTTSGQPLFADATDGEPSFTLLANFLLSNPAEVAKIQAALENSVKSTSYKQAGADCSFTASSLTQGYQNCLGTGTLIDLMYDEQFSTVDAATLYKNVISTIEGAFTGEINSYLQANTSAVNATAAQSVYTFIASIKDPKMKETVIDHLLSSVVTNIQTSSCLATGTTDTPTPTVTIDTSTPTVTTDTPTPTGTTDTPTPTATADTSTPTATTDISTPTATPTPCASLTSVAQTPVPSAGVTQVSEPSATLTAFPTGVTQTTQPTTTACPSPVSSWQGATTSTIACPYPTKWQCPPLYIRLPQVTLKQQGNLERKLLICFSYSTAK